MVRSSTYQQVPTPAGLKAIEDDSMEFFSHEMYGNFNTGVLEQYLEEKARRDGFHISRWPWKAVIAGILIGMIFTVIIEFVSLKVGLVISGTWWIHASMSASITELTPFFRYDYNWSMSQILFTASVVAFLIGIFGNLVDLSARYE